VKSDALYTYNLLYARMIKRLTIFTPPHHEFAAQTNSLHENIFLLLLN